MPPLSTHQQASQAFLNNSPALPSGGGGGSWLEKLLPTLGGIGGGLLGTALGPVGSIGGAAAGSALGQELENNMTGSTGSTLGAAEAGGIGQGIGLGVGGIAGSLLGKLGGAAAKSADLAPYKSMVKPGLNSTLSHMQELGMDIKPESLVSNIDQITGKEGAVASDVVRGAMGDTPVDLMPTQELSRNILADNSDIPGVKRLEGSLGRLLPGVDTLHNVPAADVYKARQELMDAAYNTAGIPPAIRQGYRDIALSMDGALERSGVDNNLIQNDLTPAQISQLDAIAPGLSDRLKAAMQNGVGAVRSFQKPFIDAREIAQDALDRADSRVGGIPNTGSSMSPASAGILSLVAHHPVGAAAAGAASAASKVPPEMLQNVTGALTRLTGKEPTTILSQVAAHGGGATGGGQDMKDASNKQTGTTGGGQGYDPNQLAEYLMQAIQVNPYAASSLAPVLAQLVGPIRQAQAAQSALGGLEGTYQQATGGPGILNAIMGFIPGTAGSQYNRERGAVEQQLAAAGLPSALPSLAASPSTAQQAFAAPLAGTQALGQPGSFQGTPGIPSASLLSSLPYGGY